MVIFARGGVIGLGQRILRRIRKPS
jgi:hypothetical protein